MLISCVSSETVVLFVPFAEAMAMYLSSCADVLTMCLSYAGSLSGFSVKPALHVALASWQCYSLPLQKPLTTDAEDECRQGLILQLRLQQGESTFCGVGEVAPLPGQPPCVQSCSDVDQQMMLHRYNSRYIKYKCKGIRSRKKEKNGSLGVILREAHG